MTPEAQARRVGNTAAVLRWLAAQLAADKHPLAHVPAGLVRALTDVPVDGCRGCGDPLPAPQRTGRPRSYCLACSPRKTAEKSTLAVMATKHEPLVPLDDLGVTAATTAELEAWADLAGVTLHLDYLDRHCVNLPDAYKLAEDRRRAEKQYLEAQAQRHAAFQQACDELDAALVAAFVEARNAMTVRLRGRAQFTPGENHAEAVNAGLQAARARWLAAPPDVARQCYTVSITDENGDTDSYDMNVVMPQKFVSEWVHEIARNN